MHGEKMTPQIPVPKSMMEICDLCTIVCARTVSPVQILLDDGLINMVPSKKKREREKKKGVGAPMIIQITLCPTDNKGCGQLHHPVRGKRIKFWTKDMRQNMVLLGTTDYAWV